MKQKFKSLMRFTGAILLLIPILPSFAVAEELKNAQEKDCHTIFVKADEYYQTGELEKAQELYKTCKEDFSSPNSNSSLSRLPVTQDSEEIADPIYDAEDLERGKRLWKSAQDSLKDDLKSGVFFNLIALTKIQPNFIPAHLTLADFCHKEAEYCQKFAKGDQPKSASAVLERVTTLYPDNADLITKKIEFLILEEKYLLASITARRFALINNEHPEAEKFTKLADEYLGEFERQIRQQLRSQTALTVLGSVGSAVLGNNPYRSLRGIQMIMLLAKGESNFGQQAINAFADSSRKKGLLVEDPEILDYIQGIGDKITPLMGRDFKYEFYVVKDDTVNAFALPGGKVVIHTGAILAANSEAEIAGLVGHEVAHAVLSHGYLKVIQANFIGSIGDVFGSVRQLSQTKTFVDYMAPLVNSAYSRDAERQADILGARALVAAGYSADGLRDFMITLQKTYGNRPTSYLDTHPATAERIKYLEQLIISNDYKRYSYMGVKKHQQIKEKLMNYE